MNNFFKFFLVQVLLCSIIIVEAQKEQDTTTIEGIKKMIRQSTYYDSSKVFHFGAKAIKMAKSQESLSDEATIYQYYGNFCYFSKNYTKAKEYYNISIKISEKAGDDKLTNKTKVRLNFILVDDNMLLAEKEFNEIYEEAEKKGFTENQIECLNGLGIIYEQRQMYDKAMGYYLQALQIAEKTNETYHEAMLLNNVGLIKLYSDQRESAKEDFERALKLAYQLEELRLALNLHNNLGLVSSELNDFEGAIIHYQKTLLNAHELGFPVAKGVAHLNLSSQYFQLKNYNEALIFIDSSIFIFKNYNEKNFLPKSYLLKASIFRDSNQLELATLYLDTSFILAKQIESFPDEIDAINVEASILAKYGKYELAYEKHKLYHQLYDSLSKVNNKDKVAQLQVLFGKEQLEAQLENEKNEKMLSEIRSYYIITVLVIVFIIIAVLLYLRYVMINRKQQQSFSQNLIVNIDEERSRISKDLHDDVGQLLSSIKMKVNMYNSNQIDSLKGLENEIGEVIEQTRSLSHTLHPSYIEKIGLKRSLASLIERTQQNTGKVCSFEWEVDIEEYDVDKRTQIFRIIQECINNTIKHSQASALKVIAQSQGQHVLITYRDNGIGFGNLASINSGIGLKTIEERAKKIDAKLSVESPKGKGFKLTLKL
jgi:two-component system, NarL family, sensor kinase